jgi:hypothetical protein
VSASRVTPTFADRHPLTARTLAVAIVLGLVVVCVVAIAVSWSQPHAPLLTLVGLLLAVGLQLSWYRIWRRRGRVSSAITLAAGLLGVLAMSFVCFADGWLRAFGAAVLLPFVLGATLAVASSLRRVARAS